MRFLADESCDYAVVRALRVAGHDVLSVVDAGPGAVDAGPGAKDPEVIRLAREEGRVLVTEDKDFGQLVYAGGHGGAGVVLIRFPAPARRQLPAAALDLVTRFGDRLPVSFVVLEPGRVRIGSMPRGADTE